MDDPIFQQMLENEAGEALAREYDKLLAQELAHAVFVDFVIQSALDALHIAETDPQA